MKKTLLFAFSLLISFSIFASESSLYDFSWLDKDKEVYVLQNRRFRKDGSVYLGLNGGLTTSGEFTDSVSSSVRAGYFFKENWGIELVFAKNSVKANDTFTNLQTAYNVQGFYNVPEAYTGLMLMWSPFYSKINTFNSIAYFDVILGFGLASISTIDNRQEVDTDTINGLGKTDQESVTGAILNIGGRFYINKSWSLRMDLTPVLYNGFSRKPGTDEMGSELHTSYDFTVGFNYSL